MRNTLVHDTLNPEPQNLNQNHVPQPMFVDPDNYRYWTVLGLGSHPQVGSPWPLAATVCSWQEVRPMQKEGGV